MYKNGLSYGGITLLSLLTHISLLTVVFVKGDYETIISPFLFRIYFISLYLNS